MADEKDEKKQSDQVLFWVNEIAAAKKREKEWRKEGESVLEIYSGKKKDTIPFNILFSNTETLLPALYSAVPRPVVDRRYKDDDELGKLAGQAGQRALEFLLDTNVDGYETYDEALRASTLDALLPGRGVTCVKYDAEIGELPTESVDDEVPAGEDVKEGVEPQEAAEPAPYKESELVCCDHRSWNKVYFGYAKKWSKMPWIAFEEYIDKEEATRLFNAEIANQLVYTQQKDDEDDKRKGEDRNRGETKTVVVYQIWDKDGGRKVRYVTDCYKDNFLKVEDDPLELTGFFNCPRPIQFIEKSNDLTPTAPYVLYENQAKELNNITRRINKIVSAIKARGIYDGSLGGDIADLMKADDNELVPTDSASSLAAEKGLDNAIWFMPVDKLITVLRELLNAREACKQVIFEIMGIADIMRGSSAASETLGAQEIKQTWGSLRLKRQQKEVQRYARDLLRMMLEIAATKFSEETWARMTGLPFLTEQQFAQAQMVAAAAQQQAMMPGPDGQPDPQKQQQAQQAMQAAQQPKWADILGMLKDDIQRAYRIDIETNSTVEPEAVEDQKNIADVMNALGQFLNGISPLVAKGVMPFQAAQSMMLAIVRRFRFGPEIEDYIKQMQAPPQPPDPGQADAAKHQAEQGAKVQIEQMRSADEDKKRAAEVQIANTNAAAETQRHLAEQETERQRIAGEVERDRVKADLDRRNRQAELQNLRGIEEMKAKYAQDTDLKKAALVAATQIETATITATKDANTATAANEAAGAQVASTSEMMNRILERQDNMLAALAAPKRAERDANGKLLRMVPEIAANG